mmetsp:Transcript_23829/g.55255  ORF Transcript_23829/g.55255 Transcript_23829/m.55255 type:complete len:419 (-) Transcript_23829:363-1619(-)
MRGGAAVAPSLGESDRLLVRRRPRPRAREDGDDDGQPTTRVHREAEVSGGADPRQGGEFELHAQVRHFRQESASRQRHLHGLRRRHEGAPQLPAARAAVPRGGRPHRARADAAALFQRRPHGRRLQPPELHLLLRCADGTRLLESDRLLRHQLRRPRRAARRGGLVPHRVHHGGLPALAQADSLGLALQVPRPRAHHGRGARRLAPDLQAALALVHRLLPGLLPGGDLHVGAAASRHPDALLLQLDHGLPLDHHLLPRLPHRARRLRLHQDAPDQGAHHRAGHLVDRLLLLPHHRRRDDAAQFLALLGLPRLQGELHHVVVLHQGHVEGGAWPARLQEDRLQGDGEEGRRQDQEGQAGGRQGEAGRQEQLGPHRRRGGHHVRPRRRERRVRRGRRAGAAGAARRGGGRRRRVARLDAA